MFACLQTFIRRNGTEAVTGVLTDSGGYDNVAKGMLTTLQIVTMAAWNYIMYRAIDTSNGFAMAYFLSINVLGCYFVVSGCHWSYIVAAASCGMAP